MFNVQCYQCFKRLTHHVSYLCKPKTNEQWKTNQINYENRTICMKFSTWHIQSKLEPNKVKILKSFTFNKARKRVQYHVILIRIIRELSSPFPRLVRKCSGIAYRLMNIQYSSSSNGWHIQMNIELKCATPSNYSHSYPWVLRSSVSAFIISIIST